MDGEPIVLVLALAEWLAVLLVWAAFELRAALTAARGGDGDGPA